MKVRGKEPAQGASEERKGGRGKKLQRAAGGSMTIPHESYKVASGEGLWPLFEKQNCSQKGAGETTPPGDEKGAGSREGERAG